MSFGSSFNERDCICLESRVWELETKFKKLEESTSKKSKALNISVVSGCASDFEKDLHKLIDTHCKKGLKKSDLVHKMQYVTKSVQLS